MDSLIAKAAVVKLMAAFPNNGIPQESIIVYTEALAKLEDPETLAAAVDSLILTEDRFFPTIGKVWQRYFDIAETRKPKALEPPDFGPELTPAQIAVNKKRLAELMSIATPEAA